MSHLAAETRVSAQTGFTRLKLVCAYKMVGLPNFRVEEKDKEKKRAREQTQKGTQRETQER